MRKVFIIVFSLVITLTACKKSGTGPYNNSITYSYTSTVNSRYGMSYTAANGVLADTAFSGTSFTLTVLTNETFFKSTNGNNTQATFTLENITSPATPVTGTMKIAVNNAVTDTLSVSFQQFGQNYFTTTTDVY